MAAVAEAQLKPGMPSSLPALEGTMGLSRCALVALRRAALLVELPEVTAVAPAAAAAAVVEALRALCRVLAPVRTGVLSSVMPAMGFP